MGPVCRMEGVRGREKLTRGARGSVSACRAVWAGPWQWATPKRAGACALTSSIVQSNKLQAAGTVPAELHSLQSALTAKSAVCQ